MSDEPDPVPATAVGWLGTILLTATPFVLFGLFILFDRLVR